MYQSIGSKGKEKCRNIVHKLVERYPSKRVNMISLPSTNFILEEKLLQTGRVNLVCLENDSEVYKHQVNSDVYSRLSSTYKDKFVHKRADIFDVILDSEGVNIINLDICASLQQSIVNKFISCLQSKCVTNNQYIALTVMAKREIYAKVMTEQYACTMKEFRHDKFPSICKQFAKMAGNRCKLIKQFPYKGEGNCPMIFYLFHINY